MNKSQYVCVYVCEETLRKKVRLQLSRWSGSLEEIVRQVLQRVGMCVCKREREKESVCVGGRAGQGGCLN